MEPTVPPTAKANPTNPTSALKPKAVVPVDAPSGQVSRSVGYGLPCARCRAYYPADIPACPICKSRERVSSNNTLSRPSDQAGTEPRPGAQLDDQREPYLQEVKAQAFASHTESSPATFRCVLEHQHKGSSEPAAVCHACYGNLRQLADRMEAALHMDPKEAAKIVYDAVWADPTEPHQTYHNAAAALLSELRKRAGAGLLLGSDRPFTH